MLYQKHFYRLEAPCSYPAHGHGAVAVHRHSKLAFGLSGGAEQGPRLANRSTELGLESLAETTSVRSMHSILSCGGMNAIVDDGQSRRKKVTETQMLFYLENKSGTAFVHAAHSDNGLHFRLGHVGKPCLVLQLELSKTDAEECASNVKQTMVDKGFSDAPKTVPIIDGSYASTLSSKEIKDHPVYGEIFQIGNFASYYGDGDYWILHFPQGLAFEGDLDVTRLSEWGLFAGLIIEGDVSVNGNFTQDEDDYPVAILILGNVSATNFIHADSHMVINGNVDVEQTIFGYYNDGCLDIWGDVSGEALIIDDHDLSASGAYNLFVYSSHDGDESHKDWINPKFIDLEGYVDCGRVGSFVRAGKSILRKGVSFDKERSLAELADAHEGPADAEPEEAEKIEASQELIKALDPFFKSDDYAGLTRTLVEWEDRDEGWALLTGGCIGDPSCSEEQRAALREVLNEYRKNNPATEEAAEIDDSANAEPITAENWRVPIGGNVQSKQQMHPDIIELIDAFYDNVGWQNDLSNLKARLAALQKSDVLDAHVGYLFYELMEGPEFYILRMVTERLLKLGYSPDITVMNIEGHGLFNAVKHAEQTGHMEPLSMFLEYFPSVELLLETEEEAQGLSKKDLERLEKSIKKDIKLISKMNETASAQQEKNTAEALSLFSQAKDLATPYLGAPEDIHDMISHDYLHACQGRLWCLNELVAGGDEPLKSEAIAQANDILGMESEAFYYSVEGHATRAADALAGNTLGWYAYLEGKALPPDDKARQGALEGALEYIDEALPCAVDSGDQTVAPVLENKVLILLELDRLDEAHLAVYQALNHLSTGKNYFLTIAQTKAYQAWDAAT